MSDTSLTVFTDNSKMDDGWILGPNSELLFWVPPIHRTCLWRPSNISVIGKGLVTKLNFRHFAHGTSWASCRSFNQ